MQVGNRHAAGFFLLWVGLVPLPAFSQNNLKLETRRVQKRPPHASSRKAPGVERMEFPALDERPVSQLVEAVRSFGVLQASHPKNSEQRFVMQVNRASALVAIAQKLLKAQGPSGQKRAGNYLKEANRDALSALIDLRKTRSSNRELQARAFYLLGLAHTYQGDMAKASNYFESAERLAPQSAWAVFAILFVAEQRFVERNYKAALSGYTKVLKSPDASHHLPAIYRIAWCHFNLNQNELALKWFDQALRKARQTKSNLAREIAPDMLHVALRFQKAPQVVERLDAVLEEEQKMEDRLRGATFVYREKRDYSSLNFLWDRYGSSSKTDRKLKLELLSAMLYVQSAPFASGAYSAAARQVSTSLEKMDFTYTPALDEDELIEEEKRMHLRALLDTYAKRVQSPDRSYSSSRLESDLVPFFASYIRFFPSSKHFAQVKNLLHLICIQLKQVECLEVQMAEKGVSNSDFDRLFSALWGLAEKKKDRKQIRRVFDQYSKKISAEKIRREVALRSIELWAADSSWKNAKREAEQGIADFPSDIRFAQQLGHLYFKQGLFVDLLDDKTLASLASQDKTIRDLAEQSVIRTLDTEINKNKDSKKASELIIENGSRLSAPARSLALKDYLLLLLSESKFKEFLDFYSTQNSLLSESDFGSLSTSACRWALVFSVPQTCMQTLSRLERGLKAPLRALGKGKKPRNSAQPALSEEMRFYALVSRVFEGRVTARDFSEANAFSAEYRNVLLSWLVFRDPQGFLKFVATLKAPVRDLGDFALASFRNATNSPFDEEHVDSTYLALAKKFPKQFSFKPQKPGLASPLLGQLARKSLPTRGSATYDKALADLIKYLRSLRATAAKTLAGFASADRLQALSLLEKAELLVAEALEDAKAPDGLSDDEKKTYLTEIEKLESEFRDAANAYSKSAESFAAELESTRKNVLDSVPGAPRISRFDWPNWKSSLPQTRAVADLLKDFESDKRYFQGLIVLELIKRPLKVPQSEYLWGRTGFLLGVNPSYGTREYLFSILQASGSDSKKAIEEWKDSL